MKTRYIIVFFLLGSLTATSQQVIRTTVSSAGGSETVAVGEQEYTVQQTIGQQSVIGTYATESITARQGFIQPPIRVRGIIEEDTDLDAVVYPNPFESSVRIKFNEEISGPLSVVLYDMQGRLVYDKAYEPAGEIEVQLDFLSKAAYVLLVSSENKQLKANLLKN
ncbi:T9SS type A sorting domain-containing protein [Aureisphaera galaxeae]|uniref:T9SS type A sorting domain-containing protein n=1 Tax=Aureisphaera galaxeae TaxID=1538023 RepID=UPI0023509DB2|nr:T9SS type A sorting domain-containing protein [Aureisphaera galaxeae]MDC8002663.1 T9SS type A sorting domain-containing protein [Aureisphaera galaxeae]